MIECSFIDVLFLDISMNIDEIIWYLMVGQFHVHCIPVTYIDL